MRLQFQEAVLIRQRAEPRPRRRSFPQAVDHPEDGCTGQHGDCNSYTAVTTSTKEDILLVLIDRIEGFLIALRYVMVSYNCATSCLENCIGITPGRRAPTITALRKEEWVAVSALVGSKTCHKVMDELRSAGAEDIICISLANTRM